MSIPLIIDKKTYLMQPNEVVPYTHPEYNNLKLYHFIVDLERVVDLLKDLQETFYPKLRTDLCMDSATRQSFGGYIPQECSSHFQICSIEDNEHKQDFLILSLSPFKQIFSPSAAFILTAYPIDSYISYHWNIGNTNLVLNVHPNKSQEFVQKYHWYLKSEHPNTLFFENLIHLTMIVKNAGDNFQEILERNIPHIDRWTILDTGSTDRTVQIIQDVLAPRVRGELYQEPFIDFGTSRNRCLELAGTHCKYTLMLDDTYFIEGDLRGFLNEVRSDQFADSFSLYITSDDVQYVSNRVLKSKRQLQYWFKIHEVIQEADNLNVIIPIHRARIHDKQSEYMQNRTTNRKTLDLKLLKESIQEDPDNPRHYYYMAQTYVCMQNWEMAYKYFLQRVYHSTEGFLQEKIDACFEAARTAQFRLNRPWEEVKPLYEKAYEMDNTRPDAVYFLGIKEYLDKNYKKAYEWFKKAFNIGYPIHAQYSLKPTLSYHFTPKFLVNHLCWDFDDPKLGEQAGLLYLQYNPPDPVIQSWYSIYQQLNHLPTLEPTPKRNSKPYLCFVADGNWNPWTGRDVVTKGLGGSETYIVEMARSIQASGKFQVLVFCRCSQEETYEEVQYLDLSKYYAFIASTLVHTCIVSRFSEYLPVTYKSHVENVFLVVHDLTASGVVLIRNPKLKGIFTLTEWHKSYFDQQFPTFNDLTIPLHYGVHPSFIQQPSSLKPQTFRRFIYSSFPNRGLLPLLEMWPRIRMLIPDARLDVYSNLEHPWCLKHHAEQMSKIQSIVHQAGVHVHGWVDKPTLAEAWKSADIWLYPCIFQETFCLTSLEAAASGTLAIGSDLAALQNTIGDRGILVQGNPETEQWKQLALEQLKRCLETPELAHDLIQRNYDWALAHSWENQSQELLRYIEPHRLEYRGTSDWTMDIPVGSKTITKQIVTKSLQSVICPIILDVYSQLGTSVLQLLQEIPNSSAHALDNWEYYPSVLDSFQKNISESNCEDRIQFYKNNPEIQLLNMVQDRDMAHLIYFHAPVDSIQQDRIYHHLVLCWNVLLQNGLMIVEYPELFKKPLQHFVNQYKSQLKLVYKDTRIFLLKTSL